MALDSLGGGRILVALPTSGPLHDACEVLAQERLRTWTLPHDRLDLVRSLAEDFPHRVRVGVTGALTPGDLAAAADAGASFAIAPFVRPGLVESAALPVVLGALTPTEIDAAGRQGPAGVMVFPAEGLGALQIRTLTALFPGLPLLAGGRLDRMQAEEWLDRGAAAVHVEGVVGDSMVTDLGAVRAAARGWRSVAS